jgi:hypothetical protein
MKHRLRIWLDKLHWWTIEYGAEIIVYMAVMMTLTAVLIIGGK